MLFTPRRSLPSDRGRVVKTWSKDVELNDRLVVQCFLFLIQIPKAKSDVKYCYSPLGK